MQHQWTPDGFSHGMLCRWSPWQVSPSPILWCLCNNPPHISSPERYECDSCHNPHQHATQATAADSCTVTTHGNMGASQALSLRPNRAAVPCPRSLAPWIRCFLHGSEYSTKLLKLFSVSASKNLCNLGWISLLKLTWECIKLKDLNSLT